MHTNLDLAFYPALSCPSSLVSGQYSQYSQYSQYPQDECVLPAAAEARALPPSRAQQMAGLWVWVFEMLGE